MKLSSYSENVCCCGARTWALVIGWVQFLSSLYSFFSDIRGLHTLNEYSLEVYDLALKKLGVQWTYEETEFVLTLARAIRGVGIFTGLLGMALGLILIYGVRKEMAKTVFAWTISQFIFTIMYIVEVGVGIYIATSESEQYFLAIVLCLTLVIQFFVLFVVNLHRRELEPFGSSESGMPAFERVKV